MLRQGYFIKWNEKCLDTCGTYCDPSVTGFRLKTNKQRQSKTNKQKLNSNRKKTTEATQQQKQLASPWTFKNVPIHFMNIPDFVPMAGILATILTCSPCLSHLPEKNQIILLTRHHLNGSAVDHMGVLVYMWFFWLENHRVGNGWFGSWVEFCFVISLLLETSVRNLFLPAFINR